MRKLYLLSILTEHSLKVFSYCSAATAAVVIFSHSVPLHMALIIMPELRTTLVHAIQVKNVWNNPIPSKTLPPISKHVKTAIAQELKQSGNTQAALAVSIAFSGYFWAGN